MVIVALQGFSPDLSLGTEALEECKKKTSILILKRKCLYV